MNCLRRCRCYGLRQSVAGDRPRYQARVARLRGRDAGGGTSAAHPDAALVPPLRALADADATITGGRFVAAMATGCNIACRLALMPAEPLETCEWYSPPWLGLIAATVGCSPLLGLPPDQASDALALALCQANIPGQSRRGAESHVRAVRKGFAACAAVSAVLLARAGVRGFPQPLEGDGGFVATVAGGSYDEADMLDDLGSAEIGPIEEMLVEPASARTASANSIDAKFSIPFTTATALVHGAVGLDSFSENARKDPAVLALARMVRSVRRADWTRAHAASGALTLELAGIGPLRIEIAQAAGHFEYPVSDADLVAKFVACAVRAESPLDDEPALALAARLLPAERMTSTADLLV